ncbi:NHL repeat-containing protein [Archaeoglobus neptunius]|uniref:hypothetical protein n=1 Tax=Archaeoglobus neptunius TaxID=2798580 RepID=UPI001928F5C0|nr:hypothetical protein [Archaeoglobus neptunius]
MRVLRRDLLKTSLTVISFWLFGKMPAAKAFASSYVHVDTWGVIPEDGKLYFSSPVGIAKDSWGNIYVSDMGNCRIVKLSAQGSALNKFGELGSSPGKFDLPFGVEVDGAGSIIVTDAANNRIQKFTNNGDFICEFGRFSATPGNFFSPMGIGINSSGYLYVADGLLNRIQVFAPAG